MDPDDIVDDEPLDNDELNEDLEDDLDADDPSSGEPDDDDGDPEPEPQPRKSRAQERIEALKASEKTEKERADRLERELAEARRAPAGSQKTPQELQRERDAHLATLTEAGRLEFLQREGEQRLTQRLNQIEFQTWDGNDKTAFQGLCARSPALAALETEVEQRLTELRAGGSNASRETVAKYLLGEKALAKAGRAKTAGRKREQEGRERQGARPVNGRSDAAPNGNRRTSDRAARAKRLEGMSI